MLFSVILIAISSLLVGCNHDTQLDNNSSNPNVIEDYESLGNSCLNMFYNKELDSLYDKFSSKMRAALNKKKLDIFNNQIIDGYGELVSINEQGVDKEVHKPYIEYMAVTKHKSSDKSLIMLIYFNNKGEIDGFYIREEPSIAESSYLKYKTKTELELPFRGQWYVFWGGRTLEENYHAVNAQQRFANDILIMKNGKTHDGEGDKNEDYYGFGKEIISPADGKIIDMQKDVKDNRPGVLNGEQPLGNYVVIDHHNGEYSLIAHFKFNSIVVNTGDEIEKGQLIGLCGNSGNSTEPHIHYHMQDSSNIKNSQGIPAFFNYYYADDEYVENGELLKGQLINK